MTRSWTGAVGLAMTDDRRSGRARTVHLLRQHLRDLLRLSDLEELPDFYTMLSVPHAHLEDFRCQSHDRGKKMDCCFAVFALRVTHQDRHGSRIRHTCASSSSVSEP